MEPEIVSDTLAYVRAEVLIDALADSLAEVEPETLSKTLVHVRSEVLGDAFVDTLPVKEAETQGDMEAETLVMALADTVVKDDTLRHTGRSGRRDTGQSATCHAGLLASRGKDRDTSRHSGWHASIGGGLNN